jgi:hypothetical protein
MMGLIILVVLGLYLALSAWVVWGTVRWAKNTNRKPWRWGLLAGLIMYLLVFWDHIPTLVAHKYYCDKYAGFTVHKTVEQWKQENPGVAEGLHADNRAKSYDLMPGIERLDLNERLAKDRFMESLLLGIVKRESRIVDKKNNFVLASWVDLDTDILNISLHARTLRDYKFWLSKESCDEETKRSIELKFQSFERNSMHLKENKQ